MRDVNITLALPNKMLNIRECLLYVSGTNIIEGEAPGTLRALISEDKSTWESDKYWWDNPKVLGIERHLDGRRQVVERPPRQQTFTNFVNKYVGKLERSLFGENVHLKVFEEHPNAFLEVEFDETFYHSQIFEDTNLVDLYFEIKDYHFSE